MSARLAAFAPERHVVRTTAIAPLAPGEPGDYVLRHESRLLSRAGPGGTEDPPVATARWDLLRLGLARDDRIDPYRVVAGDPEMVYAVAAAGDVTGPVPEAEGPGDVLHFRSVEVEPRADAAGVARALLEHVLRFHAGGSRAAVFVFGRGDPPAVRDALEAAGFEAIRRIRNMEIHALALSPPRPAPARRRKGTAGTARRRPGARRTGARRRRRS
ncbi:MAG TPA: hypothetical protein VLS93_11360 [Anaeromyxobacteraceae bacterium]|nr:hypothetical protein [Anaeromyxobacteraceae bacterium]